jgi:NAD(P)-dependent dehydrogenase (short-subunit alcohol dehydrogenase family)
MRDGSKMRTEQMVGRTVVVSGGASGVGLAAAKGLARLGARTIVLTRSEINGRRAMDDIRRDSGSENVHFVVGDVGSRTGARLVADAVADRGRGVNVVVSAVGSLGERGLTPAGVPRTFATNYLTHFLLTCAMTPLLRATPDSRVLIVGAAPAIVRRIRNVRVDGVDSDVTAARALTQSLAWKLLLARYVERTASDKFTVNVFHPGLVRSNLLSSASPALRMVGAISNRFAHTDCAVTDHLASDPTLTGVGGTMFDNRGRSVTLPTVVTDVNAASVWEASIALANRTD